MANRLPAFPTFANLAPPWSLPTLDSNFIATAAFANDSSLGYVNGIATDTGAANAYVVTCPFGAPTAYNAGMTVVFNPANTNTGSSTIQVLPLSGTQQIRDFSGNQIPPGAIRVGVTTVLYYIAGAFRMNIGAPFTSQQVITVSGTTTVVCPISQQISIVFDFTGAPGATTFPITLTGVTIGAHVDLNFLMAGGGQKIQFTACTDSGGHSITDIHSMDPTGTVVYNWLTALPPTNTSGGSAYLNGSCFYNANNTTSYMRFAYGFM